MPGNEIRKLRKRLGLTQQQLADKLGVDRTTVSRWERGEVEPSPMAERQLEELKGV